MKLVLFLCQMLRTCSEPDLAKLTRTAELVDAVKRTRKQSLDLEKLKSEASVALF